MKIKYNKDEFTLEKIENEINESMDGGLNLKMKEKDEKGNTRFMTAVLYDSSKVANLIIEYANRNKIVLNLNEKIKSSSNSYYPIEQAVHNGNVELVNLIINYANTNNIVLEFNDIVSLVESIFKGSNNINLIITVLDYISDINSRNKLIVNKVLNGIFLTTIKNDNLNSLKLIVDYANIKNNVLNLNESYLLNIYGEYDFLSRRIVKFLYIKNMLKQIKITFQIGNQKLLKKGLLDRCGKIAERCSYLNDYPQLVIATKNFQAENDLEEIDIIQGDIIVVMDWYTEEGNKEGWITGYKKGNIKKIGLIPKVFVKPLVIATRNYLTEEPDELSLFKNDILVVTNWEHNDGWVYGYKKDNRDQKGKFPKVFVDWNIHVSNSDNFEAGEASELPSYDEVMKREL